jgi:hypothetical protein
MSLKEILSDGDSAVAVYFWIYWYHCRHGCSLIETEVFLRMGHEMNVSLQDVPKGDDTKIYIEWDAGYHTIDVCVSYLNEVADQKYAAAIDELDRKHNQKLVKPIMSQLVFY